MCGMDGYGAAAKESIQRCTGRRARGEWWRAQEVRAAHNRLTAAVRRRRRSPLNADVDETVTAARREYRRIARDAKQRSWDLFCARVEAEKRSYRLESLAQVSRRRPARASLG